MSQKSDSCQKGTSIFRQILDETNKIIGYQDLRTSKIYSEDEFELMCIDKNLF